LAKHFGEPLKKFQKQLKRRIMNKEELFLKYLDGQLTPEKKQEVEMMLAENEANNLLFEKVKAKKEYFISELDLLNPIEPVEIPTFDNPITKIPTKKIDNIRLWHYAAIAAILIGIYFGLKQIPINREKSIANIDSEEIQISKTIYKELDCYISPNRCWNQKQLAWTFLKINH
jgi:hypothetical protein